MEQKVPTELIESWASEALNSINEFKPGELPEEFVDLYEFRINLESKLKQLQTLEFTPPTYNPVAEINLYYRQKDEEVIALRKSLKQQEEDDIQAMKDAVSERNKSATEYNAHLADKLYVKHKELKAYKKTLDYVFEHYHISPGSMTVNHNLDEKQFREMLHVALSVCRKYDTLRKKDAVYKYATKLKHSDGFYAAWTFTLFVILAFILAPFIGVINYAKLFKTTNGISDDIEALKLARSLMCEVNYMNLIDPSRRMELESEPDTAEISNEFEQKIAELPNYDAEHKEALEKSQGLIDEFNSLVEEKLNTFKVVISDRKKDLQDALKECTERIDEILKDYHPFPYKCNESATMSYKWVFARKYDAIDVAANLPQRNILFKYTDDEDRVKALNRCKLYLCNVMLSVQPRKLDITISDPLYQGADFAEFLQPSVRDYLKVVDTDFQTSIKDLRKVTYDNIKRLGTRTISDYNTEAEEKDIVTVPYKLLIIASGLTHNDKGETQGYDEKMEAYFENSVKQGVLIWIIDNANYKGMLIDSMTPDKFDGAEMIEYTEALGVQTTEIWGEALDKFKSPILLYRSKVLDRHVPKEKWWTYDTIKSAELHFGIENGDPTKFTPIPLSDQNVHALMGGATGAGKSAAINQMLMSLITMYPPSELQLMFIDFKNVEAAKFTAGVNEDGTYMDSDTMIELNQRDEYYRRYSIIPQISVISGTTDGGYAQSLFQSLNDEMARRQKILNKYGKMKVEDLRKDVLARYNKEKGKKATWHEMREDWEYYKPNVLDKGLEIPRLIVICDEFQVMFNTEVVPGRTIDKITGLITLVTKLGRAMSCHLWFTSQSMKGTLSNDVKGNFSVRGALRCAADTSNELLGSAVASTIKAKQGFMYTNTSAGQDSSQDKFWRVPFADEHEIANICSEVNELLKSNPHEKAYTAEFYDDKQLIPAFILDEWYESNPEAFSATTAFILGERAEYSVNKAPITCTLTNDTGENMLVAGFNREDLLNLVLTIIVNIKHKDNYQLIFNIADKPAHDLVKPENYVIPEMQPLCDPDIDKFDLIDMLCDIVEQRRETGEWDQPLFVVLSHWEQTPVFGYGKRENRITQALMFGPTVDVHFIIACAGRSSDFAAYAPKQCKHRLCAAMPKDAFFFITTPMVEKFPSSRNDGVFAAYEFGADASKLKIYQHKFAGEIMSREIVI